jgi:hypothetical protein
MGNPDKPGNGLLPVFYAKKVAMWQSDEVVGISPKPNQGWMSAIYDMSIKHGDEGKDDLTARADAS